MNPKDPDEIVLKGGRANVGNVVRIGDQVARPTYPQTPSVEHFLRHLSAVGISFTPRPDAHDDLGRQRLNFIPGVTPTPPYPNWAFDEGLLVEVAEHQRLLHQAARSYEPRADAVWAVSAGNYFPDLALTGDDLVVCHNDLGMTNVVVSSHSPTFVGFIDFDYCRPVSRLFDIAVAARHWVPFGDLDLAADRFDEQRPLDRARRFAMFCDVHELSTAQRRQVLHIAIAFLEHARENIKALAASGQVGFQTLLANGYEATNRATVDWLIQNEEDLAGHS